MITNDAAHIAHRVTVDVQLRTSPDTAVETRIRDWCVDELLEEVDRAASELCPDDLYVMIPRLAIDVRLDRLPWSADAHGLRLRSVREAVADALRSALADAPTPMTRAERQRSIAVAYLRHGVLPDGENPESLRRAIDEVLAVSADDRAVALQTLQLLAVPAALQRWVRATGLDSVYILLDRVSAVPAASWLRWFEQSYRLLQERQDVFVELGQLELLARLIAFVRDPVPDARIIFQRTFEALYAERESTLRSATAAQTMRIVIDASLAFVEKSWEGRSPPLRPDTAVLPAQKSEDMSDTAFDDADSAFVANAGIVLLATFLPALFSAVGARREDGSLIGDMRLPMLLHYLATGNIEAEEWELVLPKILSGLAPKDSCDVHIELTDVERREVDDLLQSAITHWEKLKSVDPDGLRSAFLTREGKLRSVDERMLLSVRAEAQDILLQYLPWQYAYIQLPWMRQLLTVEW